jgi:phosphatidate cytidylyltransferase
MDALRTRIMTALGLAAGALIIVLWLPAAATVIGLTVAVLAGAWEWSAFLRPRAAFGRFLYVAAICAMLPFAWILSGSADGRDGIMALAVFWWFIALAWIMFAPRRVAPWSAAIAGALALVPAWVALMRLRLDFPAGAQWLLFVLLLVWAADIGAFVFGRRFGRVRLAPNVSPGKTWEGVLGGAAVSLLVALWGVHWFNVPYMVFIPLCLAVVAFSIVGDLTESLLKRFAGVKDSGKLIPGHGGVMDRIDSVTGAAPVLFFGLTLLGIGP